jgi:hypothetical protein
VILIDTCASELYAQGLLWAAAQEACGVPIKYAVTTNRFGEHTYGNKMLPKNTVIIGHEVTRAALLAHWSGSGPLIGAPDLPAVLDAHRHYYQLVLAAARAGLADALTPLAAARRCDLGEFASLPDAGRLVINLHRAYADATGSKFDPFAAISDAVSCDATPPVSR